MIGLQTLDIFLTICHMVIVGFNLLGWIWKKTRMAHFIAIMITASCWFLLGIWYGIGYCPVTDWQWDLKEKLGERNLPNSFIKYWADKLTGADTNTQFIDVLIAICFAAALIITLYLNFFAKRRKQT